MDKEIDNDDLIGRRFIPFEGSRHQQIYGISWDRDPTNTIRKHNEKEMSYYKYYKDIIGKEIKDKKQPLIIAKNPKKRGINKKDPLSEITNPRYFVPELCTMIGINDEDLTNFKFMEKITEKTRLDPDDKIEQIKKCLDLFYDTTEKKANPSPKIVEVDKVKLENLNTIKNDECNTSDKKRLQYGIEINKMNDPIRPYYLIQPTFNNGKNYKLSIKDINKVIPVGRETMSTNNWICLYINQAEKESYKLLNGFIKCAKGYGIKFKNNDSNWISMKSTDPKDWIKTVESELKHRKDCKFVIFIINKKTDKLYTHLKKHSLCSNGYISQVIKLESIYRAMKNKRGPDSYFSKILLQINNKLGGCNYFLNTNSLIDEGKIMLIGIDSSHIWGKKNKKLEQRTGIAMISTKDSQFSKFHSKQEIIEEDKEYASETERAISLFIKEAYDKYLKENNQNPPQNVIIYRQGIAYNQLRYVEDEVKLISDMCKDLEIKYYYVNVNTRVTVKFFEYNLIKNDINSGEHRNPEQGLIVLDQITNKNKFEFYIQPQKVNIGSATPTYFHVPYGTMDCPELLIQLTYWTTFLYPNWQNSVRVPHVIKMAEKMSYMTAKFTQSELNEKLSEQQSFL